MANFNITCSRCGISVCSDSIMSKDQYLTIPNNQEIKLICGHIFKKEDMFKDKVETNSYKKFRLPSFSMGRINAGRLEVFDPEENLEAVEVAEPEPVHY